MCVPHVSSPCPSPCLLFVPRHWRWLRIIFFFSNPLRLVSLCSCRCRNDICRGTLFRPLQFFCKVRYVNWLTPPSRGGFACAACALPITWLTPTLHPFLFQIWHSLPPLIRFPLLTVGTDVLRINFHVSAITQTVCRSMLLWESLLSFCLSADG